MYQVLKLTPTIYLVTFYEFNHLPPRKEIDSSFLQTDKNYCFYLIDKKVPNPLIQKNVIIEHQVSETLFKAGGKFLGEWSFLLAEYYHKICDYPFFSISSRFYEKNKWLHKSLNEEWDQLFSYLDRYGWGYLPSYNRPLRYVDLDCKKKYTFVPYTRELFCLVDEIFNVKIPEEFSSTADLFCNYIGFKSRKHLEMYVEYYLPIIYHFFDKDFQPKNPFGKYVKKSGEFRNEKEFTFILELLSHLFFFKNDLNYFALHYDGYYEISEKNKSFSKIESFQIPKLTKLERYLKWKLRKARTEGWIKKITFSLDNMWS